MAKQKITRRITKILHDDLLTKDEKIEAIKPFLKSYLFSSYGLYTPMYSICGEDLSKLYSNIDCEINFRKIEIDRFYNFKNVSNLFKYHFKWRTKRNVIHVVMEITYKVNDVVTTISLFDLFLSLKKFAKSVG